VYDADALRPLSILEFARRIRKIAVTLTARTTTAGTFRPFVPPGISCVKAWLRWGEDVRGWRAAFIGGASGSGDARDV
jgi:hypothetical protein